MTELQQQAPTAQGGTLDRLITKSAAARLLSVSTRTIDRLCAQNRIEKLHVGGSVRFRLSDLLEIVQRGA